MKIAVGSDHGGLEYKNAIAKHLKELGHEVIDVGTYNLEEFKSISNNIKMKFNRKLSYNSPFLMSSGRFLYKNNKIDLPIYNSKYIKKNSNYIVFSKSKRFNSITLFNIIGDFFNELGIS